MENLSTTNFVVGEQKMSKYEVFVKFMEAYDELKKLPKLERDELQKLLDVHKRNFEFLVKIAEVKK
jgi:hypothetical protein